MGRIIVKFTPHHSLSYSEVNKKHIHSALYECLRGTPYDVVHNQKGYKFFSFSDILPVEDFVEGKIYSFFVSSPDKKFLKNLKEKLKNKSKEIIFGPLKLEIKSLRILHIPIKRIKFISASPVVITHNQKYISFYHGSWLGIFLERLKENSIKKYKVYYNEDPHVVGEIFDKLVFKKSVSVKISDKFTPYNIIGSMWYNMEKKVYDGRDEKKFYQFLFDAGIGEKTSMGFGALNEHPSLLNKVSHT